MSERGGLVLCVGVTPAFQRTLRFSELTLGEVNRCSAQAQESASGKAANVARALQTLQGEAGNLELLGFLGGDTGKNYEKLLDVPAKNVYTAAATRICQTLLADKEGEATELVEEAINPSDDEWSQLLSLIESQLENAGILVLTGSPPPEANPTRYKQIVDIARGVGQPQKLAGASSTKVLNVYSCGVPHGRQMSLCCWTVRRNLFAKHSLRPPG